jgi:hypothetical protein
VRKLVLPFVIAALVPSMAFAAKCHQFSIWKFPYPQRCYTALAPMKLLLQARPPERTTPNQERIGIPLPPLADIIWGEVGPDELRALALLRNLMSAPSIGQR